MTTLLLNKTEEKSRLAQALMPEATSPVEVMIKVNGRRYRVWAESVDALRNHPRVRRLPTGKAKRPSAQRTAAERAWAINNFGETNLPPLR